jgi:hypothetical protein
MDIKKLFFKVSKYTQIYGQEHELESFLPFDIKTDEIGNYFYEIGDSETMFCCHLDTAAHAKQSIRMMQFEDKKTDNLMYCTDETTILGADDRAGLVILLNMIEHKIPGLYYFFIGEEVGRIGSSGIVKADPEKFKKYKRCIAFDRRGYGSIISRQIGKVCCSQDFVNALSHEFSKNGMEFKNDPTGIFTDSASFTYLIPECTNLSVGYFNEHTTSEIQDITYLTQLADAVLSIKWETLPTVRNNIPFDTKKPIRKNKGKFGYTDIELYRIFYDVDDVLSDAVNLECLNFDFFEPEKEMVYVKFGEDQNSKNKVPLYIKDDAKIIVGTSEYNTLEEFLDDMKIHYNYERPKSRFFDDGDDSDEFSFEDDELEYEYDEKTDEFVMVEKSFLKNFNLSEFIFDVANHAYSNNKSYISVSEMQDLLNKYNKNVNDFIEYIYTKPEIFGRYGITWNEVEERFDILIDDLET